MERTAAREDGYIRELNEEQAWDLFDGAAEFYLGISGKEFVERWDAGYYDADPDEPNVVDVATLLPLIR